MGCLGSIPQQQKVSAIGAGNVTRPETEELCGIPLVNTGNNDQTRARAQRSRDKGAGAQVSWRELQWRGRDEQGLASATAPFAYCSLCGHALLQPSPSSKSTPREPLCSLQHRATFPQPASSAVPGKPLHLLSIFPHDPLISKTLGTLCLIISRSSS